MTKDGVKLDPRELVEGTFLSARPRVSEFPHVLVKCGRNTLQSISAASGFFLGLWGEQPTFRDNGTHYLEPSDGRITDDFVLWKLDSNQERLLEMACVGPDPRFRMFISAETPVHVLARTYEHFDSDQGSAWFGNYIDYVCDWLPDLKWALIPLEGELGWCIFATAPTAEDILAKVKIEFRRNAIPTAHLLRSEDCVLWLDIDN